MKHNWSPELRAELRRCFAYDSETGVVSRIARTSNVGPYHPGPVGSLRKGYLFTSISNGGKSINIPLHRLAYFLHTGELPPTVDHEDGVRSNNRAKNLRAASQMQNARNRTVKSGRDKHLPVGIFFVKRKRTQFRVEVMRHHKKHAAEFATLEEAIAWRVAKAKELFGDFAPLIRAALDLRRAPEIPISVTDLTKSPEGERA